MKRGFLLMALTCFLFACGPTHFATYDIGLKEVERPADAKERYGKPKIIRFKDEGKTKYSFEDGLIKIVWLPTSSQFDFVLTNKTSHSVKINWDEAVYVDQSGRSKRVIHSGVKYVDRNSPQPPTVIVRGATISDMVFPADNIYYVSGQYGGWREDPLFPSYGMGAEEVDQKASGLVGKNVQVLLPIKIEDVVNEYIFTFSIDGYEIK